MITYTEERTVLCISATAEGFVIVNLNHGGDDVEYGSHFLFRQHTPDRAREFADYLIEMVYEMGLDYTIEVIKAERDFARTLA